MRNLVAVIAVALVAACGTVVVTLSDEDLRPIGAETVSTELLIPDPCHVVHIHDADSFRIRWAIAAGVFDGTWDSRESAHRDIPGESFSLNKGCPTATVTATLTVPTLLVPDTTNCFSVAWSGSPVGTLGRDANRYRFWDDDRQWNQTVGDDVRCGTEAKQVWKREIWRLNPTATAEPAPLPTAMPAQTPVPFLSPLPIRARVSNSTELTMSADGKLGIDRKLDIERELDILRYMDILRKLDIELDLNIERYLDIERELDILRRQRR